MRIRRFWSGVSVLALMSCDKPVPAAAGPPLSLVWDVSQDNRIERIGWPAKIKNDVWLIDGPGVVRLKIRGGVEHDVKFHNAQVWRKDGPRIKTICLFLDKGTIDTVYADAMHLAADWQINKTDDIQVFKDTRAYKITHGGDGLYYAFDDGPPQPRAIEIRDSFDSASGKPYLPILVIGCGQDYDAATTQPLP